jgi:hypothetical protein
MAEDLPIRQDITRDLLDRINSPVRDIREGAVEALGIDIITALLHDKNTHIVASALEIIIATAAAGEEEALITGGVIGHLDQIQDHKDPLIQKKVHEALWLLVPEVEEIVTSKPRDDY